jgi:hypothetical protein
MQNVDTKDGNNRKLLARGIRGVTLGHGGLTAKSV